MTQTSSSLSPPQIHARRLFLWGLWVSGLYIGGLLIYAWFVQDALFGMTPDGFATFLGGIFAPLAFLWLVLGFRQQGDELQNSARALWLQGEELRNSVEQQRQLVEVSREQLTAEYEERRRAEEEADRAAQPRLLMPGAGGSYSGRARTLRLQVTSAGPVCSDVRVFADDELVAQANVLREGERAEFTLTYGAPEEVTPFVVTVRYTDLRGNQRAQRFSVPVDETGGPNGDRTLGIPVRLPGVERVGE